MTHLAPRPDRLANYGLHAALGYDFLALLIVRLLWRWINPVPSLPGAAWERYAAMAGHIALYVLMFACALTGWALAGTFRNPLTRDLLGLALPTIYQSQDRAMHGLFERRLHKILAYLLAALVVDSHAWRNASSSHQAQRCAAADAGRQAVEASGRAYFDARFFGTFLPFLRASDRPMAIACLRLLTLPPRPPLPLLSVPFCVGALRFRRPSMRRENICVPCLTSARPPVWRTTRWAASLFRKRSVRDGQP